MWSSVLLPRLKSFWAFSSQNFSSNILSYNLGTTLINDFVVTIPVSILYVLFHILLKNFVNTFNTECSFSFIIFRVIYLCYAAFMFLNFPIALIIFSLVGYRSHHVHLFTVLLSWKCFLQRVIIFPTCSISQFFIASFITDFPLGLIFPYWLHVNVLNNAFIYDISGPLLTFTSYNSLLQLVYTRTSCRSFHLY